MAKSRTRVSYFNFTSFTSLHFKAQLVKNLPAMQKLPWRRKWQPTHSSTLAWRIPRTEEPGGLQSVGLQRVGHNWATETTAAAMDMFALFLWHFTRGTCESWYICRSSLHSVILFCRSVSVKNWFQYWRNSYIKTFLALAFLRSQIWLQRWHSWFKAETRPWFCSFSSVLSHFLFDYTTLFCKASEQWFSPRPYHPEHAQSRQRHGS